MPTVPTDPREAQGTTWAQIKSGRYFTKGRKNAQEPSVLREAIAAGGKPHLAMLPPMGMAMGLEGMSALMRMKEIQKINTNIEAMLMDPNPLPPDKPPEEVREWMLGPEPTTPWRSFLASVPEAAFKAMPPGITKAMALFRLSDMKIVSPEIAASAERAQGLRGIRYPRKPLP